MDEGRKSRGLSLLELLCACGCFMILIGLSAPFLLQWRTHFQLLHALEHLQSVLLWARSEAILKKSLVLVGGSSNLRQVDGQWSKGLVVLQNGIPVKTYLGRKEIQIQFRGNFGKNSFVEFLPNGFTHGQNGHFTICLKKTKVCKKLILHFSGQIIQ